MKQPRPTPLGRTAHRIPLAITLMSVLLAGCATLVSIPVEHRISIHQADRTNGRFVAPPLTLDYFYQLEGDTLTIDGTIHFGMSTDSTDLRLALLDGEGSILRYQLIYSSGYRTAEARSGSSQEIRLQIPLAPGTDSFAFTAQSRQRSSRP